MNCLVCGKELTKKQIQIAHYKNKEAKYCSPICSKNSKERREKMSAWQIGRKLSEETKAKISKTVSKLLVGNTRARGNKGRVIPQDIRDKIRNTLNNHIVTPQSRNKMRLSAIKNIEINKFNGFQFFPRWNPKACDYFEKFDEENNTSGQHARNGGEFYIKELGYWVDYINHDLKLIMEYDEKYHNNRKEKDLQRQMEIQEIFFDYEFKRIEECK